MDSRKKSYLLIASAAFLWGLIGLFFTALTDAGLSPMQAVSLRVTVAAVVYAAYLLVRDRKAFRIRLRDVPWFIGTGILSLVFFNWCYFRTIDASSLAVAAVLLYTAPIFVTLMSAVFFREKLTGRKLLALAAAFAGCVLVTGVLSAGADRLPWPVILLGLGSGFGYALYSIFGKFALRSCSPATITVYTFLFAAAAALPLSRLWTVGPALWSRQVMGPGLGIGILCCILPYILYTKGLDGVEPGRASIVATLEPVVAALAGVLLLGEELTGVRLSGMVLVLAAVVLLNMGGRVRSREKTASKS